MAKLTLSIEPDRIAKAKNYALHHHTSISKIVSDFLDDITAKDEIKDPLLEKIKQMEVPDWIKELSIGKKVDLPDDVDYKELKYEYLKEKYGL